VAKSLFKTSISFMVMSTKLSLFFLSGTVKCPFNLLWDTPVAVQGSTTAPPKIMSLEVHAIIFLSLNLTFFKSGNGWKLMDYPKIVQQGSQFYCLNGTASFPLQVLHGAPNGTYTCGGEYHLWSFFQEVPLQLSPRVAQRWFITNPDGKNHCISFNDLTFACIV
jgi:hypothetical protein